MEMAVEYLKTKSNLSIDCETSPKPEWSALEKAGLDPYLSDVCMVQVGDIERQFIIDTRFIDPYPLKVIVEDPNVTLYGVNLKFDYKQLKTAFGWDLTNLVDTMITEMVMYCGIPKFGFSMEAMSKRYLNHTFSTLSLFSEFSVGKATRNEFREIGLKPFTYKQIVYGAGDVTIPQEIHKRQMKKVAKDNLIKCCRLEWEYIRVLAQIELAGFYLDEGMWVANKEKYMGMLDTQMGKLESYILNNYPDFEGINWNSSKQVIKLFQEIGIPTKILDKTKSAGSTKVWKDSVGKDNVSKYIKDYPIIGEFLEYKQLRRLTSAYGDKFLNNIHPITGRVHSNFYQILNTGRISSSSPNLQNIPAGEIHPITGKVSGRPGYRECFVAPKGKVLVVCDYSSQEGRVLADFSKEKSMIDFFLNGDGDIHSFVGRNMFKCEVSKKVNPHLRQKGKVTNFTIAYGGSAHKIADYFQIPKKEAQALIDMYYSAFPNLTSYFKKGHREAMKGYVLIDSITNRRSYHKDWKLFQFVDAAIKRYKSRGWTVPKKYWSNYFRLKGNIERNSQNYPIQGASGSMTKLAGIKAIAEFNKFPERKAYIVNMVHDEIVVEVDERYSKWASEVLQTAMEEAGKVFVKTLPMPAKPVISDWWTH